MPGDSPPSAEDMALELISKVSNHHTPSGGRPPSVDGDVPGTYHGYFENRHGEQSLFIYDRAKGEGLLHCGDAGWELLGGSRLRARGSR